MVFINGANVYLKYDFLMYLSMYLHVLERVDIKYDQNFFPRDGLLKKSLAFIDF